MSFSFDVFRIVFERAQLQAASFWLTRIGASAPEVGRGFMQVGALWNGATKRLYIFAAVLLFWLCGICLRLISLQVFAYGDFVQRASRQQQRSIEVSPRRGIIYDRNGHELAMSISVDSIF